MGAPKNSSKFSKFPYSSATLQIASPLLNPLFSTRSIETSPLPSKKNLILTMIPLILLFFLTTICSSAVTSPLPSSAITTPTLSAYEILKSFNFPPGLLPVGATGYDIDDSTGKFTVYFDGTCSFSLQGSYTIRYKSRISGRISQNKIQDLSGISVKVLFFWLDIGEVDREGDDLVFKVGIVSASYPIDNFEEIPKCGCGFDCANRVEDPNPNPVRSSLMGFALDW